MDSNYNVNAITYGVATQSDCSDFSFQGSIDPQDTEPFTQLSFSLNVADHQGEFVCLFAEDKV